MNRRATGVTFCAISAFLFSSRYIATAIWGSGATSWSSDGYAELLSYVGNTPTFFSVIALLAGIVYLVAAEKHEQKSESKIETKKEG
ncbi:MAG: hypothetical protein ACYTBJ_09520 [Planctomycetota bacterium]